MNIAIARKHRALVNKLYPLVLALITRLRNNANTNLRSAILKEADSYYSAISATSNQVELYREALVAARRDHETACDDYDLAQLEAANEIKALGL